jgi:membrane protease subunit HflC
MKKRIFIIPIVILAAILLIIVLSGSLFTVKENQYALVMRFSAIDRTIETAGLHFKTPFIDSVIILPKNTQVYDIKASEVLTSDKQNLTVDSFVMWRITDPLMFYQTIGTPGVAEGRLDAAAFTALKTKMGTLEKTAIINMENSTDRNDIYSEITENVANVTASYGISIIDVRVKRLDLTESNESEVYNRMESERAQMSEKYIADGQKDAALIRNEVDAKVKILVSDAQAEAAKIRAEGEAEYMRMLAEAYNSPEKQEFFEFVTALNALKASLAGTDTKTIILGKDSALAKMLTNP